MPLQIRLFRHGRTIWNSEGRCQGHEDIALDELGKSQASAVGQLVSTLEPVAIYSSDLMRCRYVADAASRASGTPVQVDKRLRERDYGVWSGLLFSEIMQRFPEEWSAWRTDEDVRLGGGESSSELFDRVSAFFRDVVATHDDGCVVVVTHGGWIRSAMEYVLMGGRSPVSIEIVGQGSMTSINMKDGFLQLHSFNEQQHLLSPVE